MSTRERLVSAGKIRPANPKTDRELRDVLIEKGYVRPAGLFCAPGSSMSHIMQKFMIRVTGR